MVLWEIKRSYFVVCLLFDAAWNYPDTLFCTDVLRSAAHIIERNFVFKRLSIFMKKIISIFICAALILLCVPMTALAANATLTGPSSVKPGEEITLSFRLSGEEISAFSGRLSFNKEQLTYVSFTNNTSWSSGDISIDATTGMITGSDSTGSSPISSAVLSITFLVNESAQNGETISVSINNITITDAAENVDAGSTTYSAAVSAPEEGASTDLISLSGNFTLSPKFDPAITFYTATVAHSVENAEINAVARDENALISISDTSLSVGENTVIIRVTASDGNVKEYVITFIRPDSSETPGSSATPSETPGATTDFPEETEPPITLPSTLLASVSTRATLTPTFDPETKVYYATVENAEDEFTISAVAQYEFASVFISSTALEEGLNTITVTVTAIGLEETVYTFYVIRMPGGSTSDPSDPENNNSNLITLITQDTLSPAFDPSITSYTATTSSNKFIIDSIIPDNPNSTIEITGTDLKYGSNEVRIIVVAPSGVSTVYTITVNCTALPESSLSSITISDGTLSPAFDPQVSKYIAYLNLDVNKVTVDATCSKSSSTVTGTGSYEVAEGLNLLILTCTASSGEKTDYMIYFIKTDLSTGILPDLSDFTKINNLYNPVEEEISTPSRSTATMRIVMAVISVLLIGGGITILVIIQKKRTLVPASSRPQGKNASESKNTYKR